MKFLLDAAWMLHTALSYGGLAIALAGVAIFGWYFVRANARAAQSEKDEIPPEAWRGKGAKRGLLVLACGALLQLASFLLAAVLPGRI